jgi:GTPase SAR1 family protein
MAFIILGADGVMLVYDVSRQESFDELQFWRDDFFQHYKSRIENKSNTDIPTYFIANKCDLGI